MNVVPSLRINHNDWADKTDQMLAGMRGLYMTGNYYGGMAIEDCVSRSHDEFNRMNR